MNNLNSVVIAGDFCLSGEEIEKRLLKTSLDPWSELRRAFGDKTPIIANLECPFTDQANGRPYKWANLKASPHLHWTLDGLAMAVLGNNHISDFGDRGARDTQTLLASKDIESVGYGDSIADAMCPAFLSLGDKRLGVVSLCCPTTNGENLATHLMAGVVPLGMQTLKQSIKTAKLQCDAVLVYLHWGPEWVHDPAPDQLRLARYAIDCGADAVLGCHSHTIQSYEQYRGRWIFYGLGNYLFRAGSAQQVLDDGRIIAVPLKLDPPNRESLVVQFAITADSGQGCLSLKQIQPMRFNDDWIPHPISVKDLTFDLAACNARLRRYTETNIEALRNTSEPVFRTQLRNGVLAYWYSNESIISPPKQLPRNPIKRVARKVSGFPKRAKSKLSRTWLTTKIKTKWLNDKRHLPLTQAHYELYDIIHRLYWDKLHDFPDLINCRDFNDKIQWLKLFDQSPEIVRCSDKILVRDYIRERVGEEHLVKLYQVHDRFSQIDFDALPQSFVIKTNHDSGSVILVRNKSSFDYHSAKSRIDSALQRPYGWTNGEWAYNYVKPKVFVEEFIEPESLTPPPDYKFYCIDGIVRFVHYIYDRGFDTKEQTLDPEGNDLATELYPSFKLGTGFRKPAVWNQMISVAERLGTGFKCVRVDLFCSGDRIYAGEMTFWPMAGCYKGEGQKKLGKFLDFDRTTFKPLLLPELEKTQSRFNLYPAVQMI
ncbi:CapA family protein [Lyngbya confervoides]|uniref:CapA family protein n=1 Tax=Lyngbya confervoides BDU141951 TaxID=1574623 RepID=A0ABD4T442_9CYAN|nr:CapA family protein [Lyngbya confervoides]MCM1983007.1 CapA family protein [Lyngbya confervoides BDU141951]